MINWLKKLFNRQQAVLPVKKEIFLSWYDFYYGRREMCSFHIEESQSGFYFKGKLGENVFLRENGEIYPSPHNKGNDEFKAKWFPKSGWSLEELEKLQMITPQERIDKEAQLMIKLLEK